MHSSCEGETNVWNFDISRMFYLSENVTENFFNHQQWWKEMKKQMNPSKSTSAKSKAGTNYTKTYKLNCQFIKSHQRQSRSYNWHWNQLSDLVILAISICRHSRQKLFTFSNIPLLVLDFLSSLVKRESKNCWPLAVVVQGAKNMR